jgi:hypothetical protein
MTSAKRVGAVGIGGLCAAIVVLIAGPLTDGSSAGVAYPGLNYVSMKKKPDAPVKKRFVLRLFTTYTHLHAGDRVSAQKGRAEAVARFHGRNNRRFHEWRITRKVDKGPKVVRRIRKALQRHGHVKFTGYVYPRDATAPFQFTCRLRHFNDLGTCAPVTTPQ